jgi:short-subunit dehydrogenase
MNTETKTAIVTGATRGVGRAIALALAANGYELWITARSQDGLMALKAELEGISNIEHHFHALDFSDQNQVLSYTNILTVLVDKIDVLVNNAGIYIPDQLLDEESALEKHMQVNFYAAHTITQSLLPLFEEQKKRSHIQHLLCSKQATASRSSKLHHQQICVVWISPSFAKNSKASSSKSDRIVAIIYQHF